MVGNKFLLDLASKNKQFLAISPGPDHPTAEGSILLDALIDYFTGTEWKEKTLADLHEFIQVVNIHPYYI